jgi:hypothetical protein
MKVTLKRQAGAVVHPLLNARAVSNKPVFLHTTLLLADSVRLAVSIILVPVRYFGVGSFEELLGGGTDVNPCALRYVSHWVSYGSLVATASGSGAAICGHDLFGTTRSGRLAHAQSESSVRRGSGQRST